MKQIPIYNKSTDQAKSHAQALRKDLTDAEQMLWSRLRRKQLGVKFRRQVPVGQYIVDFCCLSHRLVIELDGGQHAENVTYDRQRTDFIEKQGFTVVRYWNNAVLTQTDEVLENILQQISDKHS